jgi:hypothetical protein
MKPGMSVPPVWAKTIAAVKSVRWQDPLWQVWCLAIALMISGIVSHYASAPRSGEKKNAPSPAEAFVSCALAVNLGWQPEIAFAERDASPGLSAPAEAPDWRAAAEHASQLRHWHSLTRPIRNQIAGIVESPRGIRITWSGTRGGGAGALEWYHSGILEKAHGLPCDFVIGNGQRSADGGIEPTRRWIEGDDRGRELVVCLTGTEGELSSAQEAALGELINAIEARSGRQLALVTHHAGQRELLAGTD